MSEADGVAPPIVSTEPPEGRLGWALRNVSKALSMVAGAALLVMTAVVVADVALRNLFGSPLRGAVAFAETAVVVVVFGSWAWGQRKDTHVSFPIVADKLPYRRSNLVQALGLAFATIVLAPIAYRTVFLAKNSYERGETTIGLVSVPVWPAKVVISVGLIVLWLELGRSVFIKVRAFSSADTHASDRASV